MSLFLSTLLDRRELLLMLSVRNVKIRYKNSVLGFFWSLLTPICFIAIYAVFAGILGIRRTMLGESTVGFMPYLISGIVIWQYTSTCFNDALYAISGNANLIKKANFPRFMLPLSMVLANAFNFVLTLFVLLLYLIFTGQFPYDFILQPLVLLVLALIAHTALCLGLAVLISTANVFFRDTEHIIGVTSMAWFFMTPIFYPLARQTDFLASNGMAEWLAYLNPMTGILGAYRTFFLGEAVAVGGIAISVGVSLIILVAGWLLFQGNEGRFGDEL